MIKTLRITGVIVVLLALAVFAVPVIYGVKNDQNVENFLKGPEVIDVFKATLGSRPSTPVNQVHPLVQQAEVYAKIIDPPKPTITRTNPVNSRGPSIPPPPATVTPKFKLISTIYYSQYPDMSQALIEEGKRRYWVSQSSTVNHLLIEKVQDGVIVVRNGEETYELKTPDKKFDLPPAPILPDRGRITNPSRDGNVAPANRTMSSTSTSKIKVTPKTVNEEERKAKVEELFQRLKGISDSNGSAEDGSEPNMQDKAVQMQKLITEFKNANMNISDEESERLGDLGDSLEKVQDSNN